MPAGHWSGDAFIPDAEPGEFVRIEQLEANRMAENWTGDPAPMISVLWLVTDDLLDSGYTQAHARDRLGNIGRMMRQSGAGVRFRLTDNQPYRLGLHVDGETQAPVRERAAGWDQHLIWLAVMNHHVPTNPLRHILGRTPGYQSVRDSAQADIVFIETRYRGRPAPDTSICGLATIGPNSDYPIAVGTIMEVCPPEVLAHEMGHVLGLEHDRYTVFTTLIDRGATRAQAHAYLRAQGTPLGNVPPYAFGYLNCRTGQGSIMSYTLELRPARTARRPTRRPVLQPAARVRRLGIQTRRQLERAGERGPAPPGDRRRRRRLPPLAAMTDERWLAALESYADSFERWQDARKRKTGGKTPPEPSSAAVTTTAGGGSESTGETGGATHAASQRRLQGT